MTQKTIVHVVGARPNYKKIVPLMEALTGVPGIRQVLVNTGQHYDEAMSKGFLRELGLQYAGITAAQVDAHDYLLDWQRGGSGLRYANQFSVPELEQLCTRVGFEIRQTYRSDGATGDMGLYVVLRAAG